MPLHIFEPRYRNMIEEALGNERMLGMIQPRGSHPHPVPDDAQLLRGMGGRIVSFAETEDGRFVITLRGVCRFRLPVNRCRIGFRRVLPDFASFQGDLQPASEEGIDRPRLLAAARAFLLMKNIACDWRAAEAASLQALVTSLAMSCPFEPGEKQPLQANSLSDRSRLLTSLFEMAMLASDEPPAATKH